MSRSKRPLKVFGGSCRCAARDPSGESNGEPLARDRRALADAIGDLVAEAQEDWARLNEWDRIMAIEEDADEWYDASLLDDVAPPNDAGRWTFNAATYAVLGDDW